ncbi:hypothetical protein B5S32_g1412 [[Candida] boidinii]|nr:hypothetical protein B5S32_g1412 [[Candida] boidinii]
MKYLDEFDIEMINQALCFDTTDSHIQGSVDLFTTKPVGADRKLFKVIDKNYEHLLDNTTTTTTNNNDNDLHSRSLSNSSATSQNSNNATNNNNNTIIKSTTMRYRNNSESSIDNEKIRLNPEFLKLKRRSYSITNPSSSNSNSVNTQLFKIKKNSTKQKRSKSFNSPYLSPPKSFTKQSPLDDLEIRKQLQSKKSNTNSSASSTSSSTSTTTSYSKEKRSNSTNTTITRNNNDENHPVIQHDNEEDAVIDEEDISIVDINKNNTTFNDEDEEEEDEDDDYYSSKEEDDKDLLNSPFGNLSQQSSRRLFAYLIAILNASYPDYDFSSVQPKNFTCLNNSYDLIKKINSLLLSLGKSSNLDWIWQTINTHMDLENTICFQYEPPQTFLDDIQGCLWCNMYFIFNKRMKRVAYINLMSTILPPNKNNELNSIIRRRNSKIGTLDEETDVFDETQEEYDLRYNDTTNPMYADVFEDDNDEDDVIEEEDDEVDDDDEDEGYQGYNDDDEDSHRRVNGAKFSNGRGSNGVSKFRNSNNRRFNNDNNGNVSKSNTTSASPIIRNDDDDEGIATDDANELKDEKNYETIIEDEIRGDLVDQNAKDDDDEGTELSNSAGAFDSDVEMN